MPYKKKTIIVHQHERINYNRNYVQTSLVTRLTYITELHIYDNNVTISINKLRNVQKAEYIQN